MLIFFAGILVAAVLFGLAELVRRQDPAHRIEPGGKRSLVSTALLMLSILAFAIAVLSLLFHSFVSSFLNFPIRLLHGIPSWNPFHWFG